MADGVGDARPTGDAAMSKSKAAAARYEFLTLDQAAVVAEFEDDAEAEAEAVKALVVAAREGGFGHLAQAFRDERLEQEERATAEAELQRVGVQLIDVPRWGDPATPLERLVDGDGGTS